MHSGEWFDWAFITWDVSPQNRPDDTECCEIPAQLLMFLDITDCDMVNDSDYDSDSSRENEIFGYNTHKLWAVVQSAKKIHTST